MFKKGIFFILTILAFFLTTKNSLAVDTCDSNQCDPDSDKYQECLTDVRDFCSKQKSTLSNEIKLLESKYQLTLAKKTKTENDIKSKETEIEKRKNSISLLEKEINIDSGKYIIQINESYKLQKKFPSFIYLLTNNFNDFLSQHHYISLLQENTKNILINNEKKRYHLDLEKIQLEKEQSELEVLQKTLVSEKSSLASQKTTKDQLLKITETQYSAILSKLSSFASVGAECLSSPAGTGKDGYYFSQIDSRWCPQKPAGTEGCIVSGTNKPCTIGNIGCYITSTAMILKKLGVNTDPSVYASDISHIESSADMKPIDVSGIPGGGYRYCKITKNNQSDYYGIIDSELNSDSHRYVIAEVPMSPRHFVVIISGSNGNYMMHDPWKGSDKVFSYSRIYSIRIVAPIDIANSYGCY